jgi:hypothetical protein
VTCTAADDAGNTATCTFTVTVKKPEMGARETKEAVLAELEMLYQSATYWNDRYHLGNAVNYLGLSLDDRFWLEQNRLVRSKGENVFDWEIEAVEELCAMSKDSRSRVPDAVLEELADELLSADRLLAQTAIEDAIANNASAWRIQEAQRELARGDEDAAMGLCSADEAIEHYRKAWQIATKCVIKHKCTRLPSGSCRIEFWGDAGVTYTIQACGNFRDWETVGTCVGDENGSAKFDDAAASGKSIRFYRVIAP